MPKRIETAELDAIVAAIGGSTEGLSLDSLASLLPVALHRRTLQRRLEKLTKRHKVLKKGRGPSTRYLLPEAAGRPQPEAKGSTTAFVTEPGQPSLTLGLPVSPTGLEIFQAVASPPHQRKRVTYNRAFLDDYRPNDTFYLPQSLRHDLAVAGRVTDAVQPAGTYARHILDRLLIELSFHSSRLEGNRYSLLETKQLIEAGKTAAGKDAEETQMILNHKAAIEFLVESAELIDINRYTIQNLHALLSDNLLPDPGDSGRLRRREIVIGGSVYRPLAVPQIIEETFLHLLGVASAIRDPFEQAFFLLVHLPYLQPFADVNKRVSRLSANIPLIRNNLRPLAFIDVPKDDYAAGMLGIYELNRFELMRDVFAWAYRRSAEQYAVIRDSLGSPDEFKLRYRSQIKAVVAEVIRGMIPARDAQTFVAEWAKGKIEEPARPRFVAVAESELINLNEWNIARFPVTPNEFKAWLTKAG